MLLTNATARHKSQYRIEQNLDSHLTCSLPNQLKQVSGILLISLFTEWNHVVLRIPIRPPIINYLFPVMVKP